MGIDYRRLLIPRDNTWRPDTATLARLIEAWRANNYVVTPNSAAHSKMNFDTGSTDYAHAQATGASLHSRDGWRSFSDSDIALTAAGELILQWPVTNTLECGLNNPLGLYDPVEGTYYNLEVHLADDFIDYADEVVDPIDTSCTCGEDLSYSIDHPHDIFYASRVRRECPRCKQAFRPQDRVTLHRDGITGDEASLNGGAVYRFAIVIDCGKCWRTTQAEPTSAPASTAAFLALSSQALGISLYEVGCFT